VLYNAVKARRVSSRLETNIKQEIWRGNAAIISGPVYCVNGERNGDDNRWQLIIDEIISAKA
jgi:hypothetical protein